MRRLTREGVERLVPYTPGKPLEELERELGISGSIKLASNENPLGPSPKALEAISKCLHQLHRYPDGGGYELKRRLADILSVPVEQIVLGNGSNELVELAVRTFLLPGEEAVQAFPTFLMYEKIVQGAGGTMVSVPLKEFRIDLSAVKGAITPRTKLIFLANPNNPTGTVLGQEGLAAFLEELPENLIVILDEAYIEFVRDRKAAHGEKLLGAYPGLLVMRTFSKICGLAGLRIGYGLSSRRIIDYLERVRQPFNTNSLAQAGAAAALEDTGFLEKTRRVVHEGIDYLTAELEAMGLEYVPTQTNFLLIRIPGGGRSLFERMLREGVIIRAMDSYGLPEHIRVTVGLAEENARFIATLRRLLAGATP